MRMLKRVPYLSSKRAIKPQRVRLMILILSKSVTSMNRDQPQNETRKNKIVKYHLLISITLNLYFVRGYIYVFGCIYMYK